MTSLKQAGRIIFSTANAACKHFVKLKYDNKYRLQFKTVAVEGADVIADLVTSGKEIECLLTDDLEPHNLILSASKEVLHCSPTIIQEITRRRPSDSYIAEFKEPIWEESLLEQPLGSRFNHKILIIHDLEDPNTLGQLIRSAYCLGFHRIWLVGDGNITNNLFSNECLQSSKAAQWQIPIINMDKDEIFERLNGQKASVFVSSLDGDDIKSVEWVDHEENFKSGAIFCVLGKYIDDLIVEFRTHSSKNVKLIPEEICVGSSTNNIYMDHVCSAAALMYGINFKASSVKRNNVPILSSD